MLIFVFFFKQKTAYEMRISDWSSDVCSSDLFFPACAFAAQDSVDPGFGLVDRQRHADHAGRRDKYVRGLTAECARNARGDRLHRRASAIAGEGIGIARVHDQCPRLSERQRLATPDRKSTRLNSSH